MCVPLHVVMKLKLVNKDCSGCLLRRMSIDISVWMLQMVAVRLLKM